MDDNLKPLKPDEAVEWYLEEKSLEYANSTIQSHRSRLGHFLKWCNEQSITNLNDLTGRKLKRYRAWRQKDGDLAKPSLKSQIDTLRVFTRWCETIDAVPQDLSTKVVSPSLSEDENVRDVMVEQDQAERILGYLERYEYAFERHVAFHLLWHCAFRRGALVALDLGDFDADEQYLAVRHRPDTGTPVKNQERGERLVAIDDFTELLDAWIQDRRPDVQDRFERIPLISTKNGRVHPGTVQNWVYSLTRPCFTTDECPHDRNPLECDAATDQSKSHECPSSMSPHTVRRGALTHWLQSDTPEVFACARANLTSEILELHYDRQSAMDRMHQRRKYLSNI